MKVGWSDLYREKKRIKTFPVEEGRIDERLQHEAEEPTKRSQTESICVMMQVEGEKGGEKLKEPVVACGRVVA